MKISVITPSIRQESLSLVEESLAKQTFGDYEWIVCSPFEYQKSDIWIKDQPKKPNYFWNLYAATNLLFKYAHSPLVVMCADSQYMMSDVLEKFWNHYKKDPMLCVAGIGDHYEKVIHGKGENLTYHDVRWGQYQHEFNPSTLTNFDTCLCSIPKEAINEVGFIDETFDEGCCFGEREHLNRIRKVGYQLYIDLSINFLAQKHDKPYDPDNKWPEMFEKNKTKYERMIDSKD